MPTEENILTLTIETVAYGGAGVAHLNGLVIFVPDVLPGESVRVVITRRKKRYAEARLLEIITPAKERIEPTCPLTSRCPGCSYQHTTYENEIQLKQQQFEDLLARMGYIDASICRTPVPSPLAQGYRNKLVLHAKTENGQILLGYVSKDHRTLIDVPQCPLAAPAINQQLSQLRSDPTLMASLSDNVSLTLRYTEEDGACWWIDPSEEDAKPLTESAPVGLLQIPRQSFVQINPAISAEVVAEVSNYLKEQKTQQVIDMYCGTGLFAFAAAATGCRDIVGMDTDAAAIHAARRNAHRLGYPFITFQNTRSRDGLRAQQKIPSQKDCTLILDPPRCGLHPDARTALIEVQAKEIIYISCAADTMARDAALLCESGYRAVSTRLFDMFPRTRHFESVTRFLH